MGRLTQLASGLLFIISLLLISLFASGCGGGTTTALADDDQGGNTSPPAYQATEIFSQVPEIPWDDEGGLHGVSETPGTQVEILGSEYLQKHNAEVEGTTLVMTGRPEDEEGDGPNVAYGLYRVSGLSGMRPLALVTECLPAFLGNHYFIGVADYTEGRWLEFGPISTPEYEIDLSGEDHRFISQLGNLYFVIVVPPGHSATHHKSTLFLAGGGDDPPLLPGAPHELVATDGAFETHVVIEWNKGDGAAYYEVWRQPTNDYHGASAEPEWVRIGTPETNRFVDDDVEAGRIYRYKARSVNNAGMSEFSNIDTGYAGSAGGGEGDPPGKPIELWATDGEFENGVKVQWDGGEGAAWFRIARQDVEPETEWVVIGESEANHYFDDDVEPGKVYRYKAQAVNEHGHSEWSNTDTGYAAGGSGGDPPGAPFELWASDGTYEGGVKLEWGGGEGAAWFRIARQDVEPASEWAVIGEADGHTYFDEEVVPGKVYRYKVQAVNEHGHSEWSNTDTGYAAGGGGPPDRPIELQASDGTFTTGVLVEWWGGEGASHFIVQRRHGEGEWQTIGDPTVREFFDETAEPGVVYKYRAQSINEHGHSDWSNTDTGYRGEGGDPPGKPIELWATDGEFENAVKVQWDGGAGAAWFRIARQDVEPETEWVVIGESEGNHYWDEAVVPGKLYRYKAQAVNEHGHSDWSNTDTGYAAEGGGDGYKIGGFVRKGELGFSCAVTLLVVGDDEVTVETGENGHYLFDGLTPGMYIVYPQHPLHRFTPDYQVVHLTPEHPVAEVNFSAWEADDTHQAFGFVYSLVSGEGGIELVPLGGVNVVAWQEGTEFEVHVTTNEDGYFRIFDLPDGVVLFKPTKEGYVFVPTIHDATIGEGIPHSLNFRGHVAE
jgi:fibronectin type 3 domain-containing protein